MVKKVEMFNALITVPQGLPFVGFRPSNKQVLRLHKGIISLTDVTIEHNIEFPPKGNLPYEPPPTSNEVVVWGTSGTCAQAHVQIGGTRREQEEGRNKIGKREEGER